MENTVKEHTFQKFDQSKKTPDLVKKTVVATLPQTGRFSALYH